MVEGHCASYLTLTIRKTSTRWAKKPVTGRWKHFDDCCYSGSKCFGTALTPDGEFNDVLLLTGKKKKSHLAILPIFHSLFLVNLCCPSFAAHFQNMVLNKAEGFFWTSLLVFPLTRRGLKQHLVEVNRTKFKQSKKQTVESWFSLMTDLGNIIGICISVHFRSNT